MCGKMCRMMLGGAAVVLAIGAALGCAPASRNGSQGSDPRPGATERTETMSEAAIEITDANFDEVTSKGVALVDFWATWCPPCRMQGPIVEKLAEKYAGRAAVGKLDVDANPKTAAKFGVRSIPTLVVLKDGEEFKKLIGLQTEDALAAVLDEALGE